MGFTTFMNEISSERIATALRGAALRDFSKGDAIEAGVRGLGCACDTDFTYTVSLDEANAEQCVGVQQWMTIGHDGQDFLGPYFDKIDQDGNGEIDHQEATNAFNFAIDLENTIHMVFCACGHDENSENDFTMIDFNEDGILTPGEVFYAAMNADE